MYFKAKKEQSLTCFVIRTSQIILHMTRQMHTWIRGRWNCKGISFWNFISLSTHIAFSCWTWQDLSNHLANETVGERFMYISVSSSLLPTMFNSNYDWGIEGKKKTVRRAEGPGWRYIYLFIWLLRVTMDLITHYHKSWSKESMHGGIIAAISFDLDKLTIASFQYFI